MSIPLNLHPRAIGTWLTPAEHPVARAGDPPDSSYGWLDSSLELQHGLDVLELTGDAPVLQARAEVERGR